MGKFKSFLDQICNVFFSEFSSNIHIKTNLTVREHCTARRRLFGDRFGRENYDLGYFRWRGGPKLQTNNPYILKRRNFKFNPLVLHSTLINGQDRDVWVFLKTMFLTNIWYYWAHIIVLNFVIWNFRQKNVFLLFISWLSFLVSSLNKKQKKKAFFIVRIFTQLLVMRACTSHAPIEFFQLLTWNWIWYKHFRTGYWIQVWIFEARKFQKI